MTEDLALTYLRFLIRVGLTFTIWTGITFLVSPLLGFVVSFVFIPWVFGLIHFEEPQHDSEPATDTYAIGFDPTPNESFQEESLIGYLPKGVSKLSKETRNMDS